MGLPLMYVVIEWHPTGKIQDSTRKPCGSPVFGEIWSRQSADAVHTYIFVFCVLYRDLCEVIELDITLRSPPVGRKPNAARGQGRRKRSEAGR